MKLYFAEVPYSLEAKLQMSSFKLKPLGLTDSQ